MAGEDEVEQDIHDVVFPVRWKITVLMADVLEYNLLDLAAIAIKANEGERDVNTLHEEHGNGCAFHILLDALVSAARVNWEKIGLEVARGKDDRKRLDEFFPFVLTTELAEPVILVIVSVSLGVSANGQLEDICDDEHDGA